MNTEIGAKRNTRSKKNSKKNDGIAFHFHETAHTIDFENTQIIAEEKAYWKRTIIEAKQKEQTYLYGI